MESAGDAGDGQRNGDCGTTMTRDRAQSERYYKALFIFHDQRVCSSISVLVKYKSYFEDGRSYTTQVDLKSIGPKHQHQAESEMESTDYEETNINES